MFLLSFKDSAAQMQSLVQFMGGGGGYTGLDSTRREIMFLLLIKDSAARMQSLVRTFLGLGGARSGIAGRCTSAPAGWGPDMVPTSLVEMLVLYVVDPAEFPHSFTS